MEAVWIAGLKRVAIGAKAARIPDAVGRLGRS